MNLLRLKIKNYLSYKSEDIDFSDKDGLFAIIGRNDEGVNEEEGNGAGKTALISSIPFAFYGRCRGNFDKSLNNEDVIYKFEDDSRAKKCEIDVEFSHGGKFYRVYRSVSDKGSQTLNFYGRESEEADWNDLTLKAGLNKRTGKRESGIFRTEQRIADVLGCNLDLFINSVYFEQSNIDTFAKGTLSEKDGIFKTAIGMNRWNDYGQYMSEDLKFVEKDLSNIQAIIGDCKDKEFYKSRIFNTKEEIKSVETEIQNNRNHLEKERGDYDDVAKQLSIEEDKIQSRDSVRKELESIRRKICDLDSSINLKDKQNQELRSTIEQKENQIESAKKSVESQAEAIKHLESEVSNRTVEDKMKLETARTDVLAKKVRMSTLVEEIVKKGKSIPTMTCPLGLDCEQLTPEAKERYRQECLSEYDKLKEEEEDLTATLEEVEGELKRTNLELEKKEKLSRAVAQKESDEEKIKTAQEAVSEFRKLESSNKTRLEEMIDEINEKRKAEKELVDKFNSIDVSVLEKLKEKMNEIKNGISERENMISSLRTKLGELGNIIKESQATLDKINELESRFKELEERKAIIKYSLDLVRKEIPHILVANAIPEIRDYARDFIYKLSNGRLDMDFRMEKTLKTSDITNAFDIWVCVDGRWLKYEQTSGGERARTDVALHLAFVCFMANMAKTRHETIFLDEVGAALDKNGVQNFVDILGILVTRYGFKKIFNITQNVDIKKMIDNKYLVVKTSEGSKVRVI